MRQTVPAYVPNRRPIPVYWIIVGVACMIVSPLLSVLAAVNISENNAQRIIARQEQSKAEAAQTTRQLVCSYFAANLDAYAETPPTTPAGKNLRQTSLDFYTNTGCQPPRK